MNFTRENLGEKEPWPVNLACCAAEPEATHEGFENLRNGKEVQIVGSGCSTLRFVPTPPAPDKAPEGCPQRAAFSPAAHSRK